MKILIVEDHPETRRLLCRLVSPWAEAVYECGDGAAALAAYTRYRPDWVLMDIELPGLDGLAATRQLKTAWPQARVIIVTLYAELQPAACAAGAEALVSKDDLSVLVRLLQTAAA